MPEELYNLQTNALQLGTREYFYNVKEKYNTALQQARANDLILEIHGDYTTRFSVKPGRLAESPDIEVTGNGSTIKLPQGTVLCLPRNVQGDPNLRRVIFRTDQDVSYSVSILNNGKYWLFAGYTYSSTPTLFARTGATPPPEHNAACIAYFTVLGGKVDTITAYAPQPDDCFSEIERRTGAFTADMSRADASAWAA